MGVSEGRGAQVCDREPPSWLGYEQQSLWGGLDGFFPSKPLGGLSTSPRFLWETTVRAKPPLCLSCSLPQGMHLGPCISHAGQRELLGPALAPSQGCWGTALPGQLGQHPRSKEAAPAGGGELICPPGQPGSTRWQLSALSPLRR